MGILLTVGVLLVKGGDYHKGSMDGSVNEAHHCSTFFSMTNSP